MAITQRRAQGSAKKKGPPAQAAKAKPKPKAAAAKPKPKAAAARPKAPAAKPAPAKPAPAKPAPAPAPPPKPALVELPAELDVFRLTRYGERIGPYRIEIQMLPAPLAVTSGRVAVADPAHRKGGFALARTLAPGRYRCTLSTIQEGGAPVVAAAVLHVGKGPVVRWVVAHAEGKRAPRSIEEARGYVVASGTGAFLDAAALDRPADATPPPAAEGTPAPPDTLTFPAGKGPGTYLSYWGLDAEGNPAALVSDFAVFTKKDWKARPS